MEKQLNFKLFAVKLFHDIGSYHIETSPLICYANQWTGFYMIGTYVMKQLNHLPHTPKDT